MRLGKRQIEMLRAIAQYKTWSDDSPYVWNNVHATRAIFDSLERRALVASNDDVYRITETGKMVAKRYEFFVI